MIGIGGEHTCAVRTDGTVKCWGANDYGQLGLGDTESRGDTFGEMRDTFGEMGDALPPVDLGTGQTPIGIAAGNETACALFVGGLVKCWGGNDLGQLGLGDTGNRADMPGEMGDALPPVNLGTGPAAVAIAAGDGHACALLDGGAVKCWGLKPSGELGLGDTMTRGDFSGDMGDALPTVDLGTGRSAVAIAAGETHTCAVLDDATVRCWGYNAFGQLGLGDTRNRGDMPGQMGDNLPAVDLGTGQMAVAVAAGGLHTCALLDDGAVKCWGNNDFGQLGVGDTWSRGGTPFDMGDALPAVGLGTARRAVAIAANGTHTCALLDDGTVKCWGCNLYGELGLGDRRNRGESPGEMGDALPAVDLGAGRHALAVWCGPDAAHTCAVLDNDTVKCWGWNSSGQLGLGDTNNRGDQPGEMGDNLPAVDLGR